MLTGGVVQCILLYNYRERLYLCAIIVHIHYIYYVILGGYRPSCSKSKVIGAGNVKGIIHILAFVVLFMLSGSCLRPDR